MPDVIRPCVLQNGDDSISTPNIFWPCVHSKGEDNISCLRSSERVSYPRAMMASHTRRCFTLCMLFKGDNGMSCPIFADYVCCPRFMMACHARRSSTLYVFLGRWSHSRTDVIQPLVQPNGDDNMQRLTSSDLGDMTFRTSSNHLCFRREMITCHARRRLIVYLYKCDDCMPRLKSVDRVYIPRAIMACPRLTSSDRVYCPLAMMECHAGCCLIMFCYPRAMIACHVWYCLIGFCYPRAMMAYHARRSLIVCAVKRWWCHIRSTSSNCVCKNRENL